MDLDKNGAIAVVSLCGLVMAAVVQPAAGFLSDRSQLRSGHRTTFMAIGAVGLVAAAISLGTADAFGAMLIAVIWLQVSGNFIQGPANALLVDHVPPSRIGAAAGLLNVFKVAGAGVFVITVLLLMDNYDRDTGRVWLWASLALLVCVVVASALWTVLSLRMRRGAPLIPAFAEELARRPARRPAPPARSEGRRRGAYVLFLLSLVFVIAAMSAMQVYSIPFLEDAVGLANPARGAALLALVVAVSTAAVAVPAGRLQDRFGHRPLLVAAGVSGAAAALLLMAAHTLVHVMFIGVVAGFSIGIFVSVTWAMANGLVPRTAAARELGYTGVATLAGAALARIGGPGIDALNSGTPELGYRVMLGAIAVAFLITPALLWLVTGTGAAREPGESGRTV
jgi:MFS family permease